ncbi:MAG: OsmC family protein [Bacteroidetes bacterium]|uniref:OsmC family protein n=1 Tax=Chitinophaga TaxID=79328 RepID=UPI0009C9D3AA|nr:MULTISPECIES: OsmC family protein [Chitinophaga]MBP1651896.1 OsmC family protein [Bacteroidota bacterium]OMP79497.1 OsmC family peroxiredoxin [[Flexibacter] sp. ATCC 35208]WPQ63901.1 OsmC family protein [Chitinophaga sancti]WPV68349.1 OsmC family protein [Chitinophaga sp. LS1]
MKRNASANWQGTGKDGKGTVTTQSAVLSSTPYSYKSRFEDGNGTNPEELIAAAHAGCFTMKLSFLISGAGFTPENLDTKATVTLENGAVTGSHLELKATVPGLDAAKFAELAEEARTNCPISKLLNTEITLDASLA